MAKQIKSEYVDKGILRYYFMDFPLAFHKKAPKAHEAANCAGEQGRFWEMSEVIFTNQKAMEPEDLVKHAGSIGLDMARFKACFEGSTYKDDIQKDLAEGRRAGVTGTPSFLLAEVKPGGEKVHAVKFIRGAQPFERFKQEIDAFLKEQKEKK